MEDIFTVFQASKYCSVSPKTIINWIEAGHIDAYKTVGGHRRIKRDALEVFMRKQGIPFPDGEIESERKRILIVDDDQIIVETLVQALEEDDHDYEIISAADGFEAGIQVNHFTVDAVLFLQYVCCLQAPVHGNVVTEQGNVSPFLRDFRTLQGHEVFFVGHFAFHVVHELVFINEHRVITTHG